MKSLLKKVLPSSAIRLAKAANSRLFQKDNRLPVLPSSASPKLRTLLEAWTIARNADASAPGECLAYYSVVEEGVRFPGEREWQPRWDVLRSIVDFEGLRVLELGCNMGLLASHLSSECQAAAVMGVDHDAEVLKAARKVAEAYGAQVTFGQTDFDANENWEAELLAFKPDLVFALNVLNWVKGKERFLQFLGNFEQIIFEGHDLLEVESERLKGVGFTKIVPIAKTERYRDVLHCMK